MNFEIKDEDVNYDEYFKLEDVSKETKDKLNKIDIIVVPICYKGNEYFFAQETIDFIKFCRQNDEFHSYDVLADGDLKIRSLHSFDIWMPFIWIRDNLFFPIVINIVSNYIWEKRKGREEEKVQVNVKFFIKSKKKMIYYNGDADTFKETFEKIDINKL